MTQLEVIELLVKEAARQLWYPIVHDLGFSLSLPFNVLEEHCDWNWNEILDGERSCDREIAQRDEVSLLSVEIDEASYTVSICIESEEDLIITSIDDEIVARHARSEYNRLLLEDVSFIL